MDEAAENIFLEALEMPVDQRGAFIESACGENLELLQAVETYLADWQKAEVIFSPTADEEFLPSGSQFLDRPGDQVGCFTLLEVIGEGGFGVVWLAEQRAPITRRVAIKIVKAGMDTTEVLARFEAERQALARMEHPHIARVLDAGTTSKGRPYFAMEWVRGKPINKFCDEAGLSTHERLSLFFEVCSAVGHAHQKGIIHRDIKPSNVLVALEDGRPVVKVIDFGIAKAVEGRLTDHTLVTRLEQILGTPAYMSPEQAGLGGGDVDTRSDIYALGVLLYELLAGVPPFDSKTLLRAGYDEMRRVIMEEDPARPSTRLTSIDPGLAGKIAACRKVTPDGLRKLIAAELDWIVMKAIEKMPERRYESAGAFALDINRFLQNETVLARPPSRWYFLSKFAERHRSALTVFFLFILLLVAATAVSTTLAIRASRAEKLAEIRMEEAIAERNAKDEALKDAEEVTRLMSEMFTNPVPSHDGRTVTLMDALDESLQRLNQTLAGQPERLLRLKSVIADTYNGLELFDRALSLRQQILEQRRKSPTVNPVRFIDSLADYAEASAKAGLFQQAVSAAKEALQLSHEKLGDDHERTRSLELKLQDYERRAKMFPKSDASKGKEPSSPEAQRDAAKISEKRVAAKERLRKMDAKLAELRKEHAPDAPVILDFLNQMAAAYFSSQYRSDAVRLQQELLALHLRNHPPDDPRTLEIENDLAYYLDRSEKWGEAAQLQTEVLEKALKVHGEDHPLVLGLQARLILWFFLTGKLEQARLMGEEAVPRMDRVFGTTHRTTAHGRSGLGRAYATLGETSKAIETLRRCGPYMADDTYANMVLAALQAWRRDERGFNDTRRWMMAYCIEARDRFTNRADLLYNNILICLIRPPEDSAQAAEMLKTFERADVIGSAQNSPPQRDTAKTFRNLVGGILSYRLGKFDDAESRLRACLAHYSKPLRKNKPVIRQFQATFFLAMTLHRSGKAEEAHTLFSQAIEELPATSSQENPLFGKNDAGGESLMMWLAAREAGEVLEKE